MSIVYVGLDLGSSNFQQVALNHDGVSRVNRDFRTSEANLVKAFSDLKGEIEVHLEAGELAPWAASIIAPLVTRVVLLASLSTVIAFNCLSDQIDHSLTALGLVIIAYMQVAIV